MSFAAQAERAAAEEFRRRYEREHLMPWPHGDDPTQWPAGVNTAFWQFFAIFSAGVIWRGQHVVEQLLASRGAR